MMSTKYDDIEEEKKASNLEIESADQADEVDNFSNSPFDSRVLEYTYSRPLPSHEIEEIPDEEWAAIVLSSPATTSASNTPIHEQGPQPRILNLWGKLYRLIWGKCGLSSSRRDIFVLQSDYATDEYDNVAGEADMDSDSERCPGGVFESNNLLSASAEIYEEGVIGNAYKAVLKDGTTIVVKKLERLMVGKREFKQQMEIIEKVGHHPNVVQLLAYYYSKDDQFLIYGYTPGRSLSSILHGGNRGRGRTPLDWDSRLKIALGASRGLANIHSEGAGSKFTHGNFSSSKVLVTEESEASIADFGTCYLTGGPALSQESDVQRFGVLLLELLTGRNIQYMESFGLLLLELLTGDNIPNMESFDLLLLEFLQEYTAEHFDAELTTYLNSIRQEEMMGMLQIARACIAKSPDDRPKMDEVVRMIAESPALSQESDVQRFGVRLLELLTGRDIQYMESFGLLLLELLTGDNIPNMESFDLLLLEFLQEYTAEHFDAELTTYPNSIRQEEMMGMLQIARACIAKSPDDRPKMDEVVRMIADLKKQNFSIRGVVEGRQCNPFTSGNINRYTFLFGLTFAVAVYLNLCR